jgi:hypothetical protein
MTVPVRVISETPRRARPKSRIFVARLGRTRIFAGLRSRWMTPFEWA